MTLVDSEVLLYVELLSRVGSSEAEFESYELVDSLVTLVVEVCGTAATTGGGLTTTGAGCTTTRGDVGTYSVVRVSLVVDEHAASIPIP